LYGSDDAIGKKNWDAVDDGIAAGTAGADDGVGLKLQGVMADGADEPM
jgi:hypothetical protein